MAKRKKSLVCGSSVPNPAIGADGAKYWYNAKGQFHREDGPAVERADGHKEWYLNGILHREDGPAIEWPGIKYWYRNGQRHREGGPAVEWSDGGREWYRNNLLHREDGPAVEYADGRTEFWLDGVKVHPLRVYARMAGLG